MKEIPKKIKIPPFFLFQWQQNGIGWTNFTAVAMETKKEEFKKYLDSFHQTS
jgi:hypothetical protein